MPTKYDLSFLEELTKLNSAQKEAVEQLEGPVLVIAGPGTGKTQILSARIGKILSAPEVQAAPHNILCLTYTEAGTLAMRKRLLQFIGPEAYRVHIYTFHAFCNQVIQENLEHFGFRELQPISELEAVELFQQLIDSLPPQHLLKRYTGDVYFEIGRLKNLFDLMKKENWSPEFISEKVDEYLIDLPLREDFQYKRANKTKGIKAGDLNERLLGPEKEKVEKLRAAAAEYPRFKQMMQDRKRYDYNDMILWTLEAFKKNESILIQYQERYQYFLVDEFQDTSGAQNGILNALTQFWDSPNVFVVGDDDQSIYRFQGANVKNIVDFYDRYKDSLKTILLTENYRSTQAILDASRAVIENNEERLVRKIDGLDKTLFAKGKDAVASLVQPSVIEYYNNLHEEAAIVKKLEALHLQGEDLSEVAVIYRSHKLAENIVKALEKKRIPLNIKQKINILELPLIESILNIFTYIQEEFEKPHSCEHLLYQMMHYNFFNIEARDIAIIARTCSIRDDKEKRYWRELIGSEKRLFQLNLETSKEISVLESNLIYWIKELPNLTIQGLFEKIITKGNILSYIMNSPEKTWLMQVLSTFFDFIKEETAKTADMKLKDLLQMLTQMKKNKIPLHLNKIIHAEKGINFITAHSSKGLEFKHVFLISSTSSNWEKQSSQSRTYRLPDTLSESDSENKSEEERRLFYVAITRAKVHLNISYPGKDKKDKALEMSQFVAEVLDKTSIKTENISLSDDDILNFQAEIMMGGSAEISLDTAFLKDTLKNYKMSVTHLNKYLKCPLSFYFENVIRVPSARSESMGFGSAIHYALYMLFYKMNNSEQKVFPSKTEFLKFFELGMKNHHSHFTEIEYERKMEFAKDLLPEYYDCYINNWNKITTVEYRINNAEMEGIPLTGALDKVEFDGLKINVVDYKTGSPENGRKKLSPPSEKNPLGGDYWRQIVFYKILSESDHTKNYEMISGEIDFIQKDAKKEFSKVKVYVNPEDVIFVKNQIKDSYQKIMNLEFTKGCQEDDCQWCNFVKTHYQDNNLDLSEIEEN